MDKELWVDVYLDYYKNDYQVSNFGRVRSKDRIFIMKNGVKRPYKSTIKKPTFNNKRGYYYTTLKKKNISKTITVHTLVYRSFKEYDNSLVIDHIDNNQKNNRLNNLQQITKRENCSKDKKTPNVCYVKKSKKYMAYIWNNGKNNHLGYFKTLEEAQKVVEQYKKNNNV